MMHVSFAWTIDDLLAGRKTATRRCWTDSHATKFHEGDLVTALNMDLRGGGKEIATLKLTRDPYKQPLSQMTEEDLRKEGTVWGSLEDFRAGFPCPEPWVIEFELVAIGSS